VSPDLASSRRFAPERDCSRPIVRSGICSQKAYLSAFVPCGFRLSHFENEGNCWENIH
jgi:hypothetical protein